MFISFWLYLCFLYIPSNVIVYPIMFHPSIEILLFWELIFLKLVYTDIFDIFMIYLHVIYWLKSQEWIRRTLASLPDHLFTQVPFIHPSFYDEFLFKMCVLKHVFVIYTFNRHECVVISLIVLLYLAYWALFTSSLCLPTRVKPSQPSLYPNIPHPSIHLSCVFNVLNIYLQANYLYIQNTL